MSSLLLALFPRSASEDLAHAPTHAKEQLLPTRALIHRIIIMAADDGDKQATASADKKTPEKKYRKKRPVPPLTELLAEGSEESRGKKKTWKELVIPPFILAVVFFLSFLLFMQVFPHLPNNRKFQLPQKDQHEPKISPGIPDANREEQEPPQEEPEEEKVVNMAEF